MNLFTILQPLRRRGWGNVETEEEGGGSDVETRLTRDWIEIDRKHDELKLSMEVDRNDMFGRHKQNRWHHKQEMRQHRAKAKGVELKGAHINNTELVLEQSAT